MTNDTEELIKDMESVVDDYSELEREYIALREAADALASIFNRHWRGDCFSGVTNDDAEAINATIAAYRKATK